MTDPTDRLAYKDRPTVAGCGDRACRLSNEVAWAASAAGHVRSDAYRAKCDLASEPPLLVHFNGPAKHLKAVNAHFGRTASIPRG